MFFKYQTQKGFLKYLFTNYQSNYYSYFSYYSEEYSRNNPTIGAVNWNDSSYMHGHDIKICLNYHKILPIGYEIQSTSYKCQPVNFSIAGIDKSGDLSYSQNSSFELNENEIVYVDWTPNVFFQCIIFQFFGNYSTCKENWADLQQIEFFGLVTSQRNLCSKIICFIPKIQVHYFISIFISFDR